MPNVIALVGPTCTGKTALSLLLAEAIGGEIVVCDSRTVYQLMDIGTAKPSLDEQKKVKHHAMDLLRPERFLTVVEYKEHALKAIFSIQAQNKIPIVCGGTGFYARALLEGVAIPPVAPHPELREELNELAEKYGDAHIHEILKQLDPITHARLNVNDRRRIIRALEVSMVTGSPFSQLALRTIPPFETIWYGLKWNDRTKHKKAIEERLLVQFKAGLLEEVNELWREPNYHGVLSQAINYKEVIPYLEGKETLDSLYSACITHNFQLARKQMIWFKRNPMINWFCVDQMQTGQILQGMLDQIGARF